MTRAKEMTMERTAGWRAWLVLVFAWVGAAITGCAIHYTDDSGAERNRRVVDKATGAGVPGAFVVFKWNEERDSLAHSTTICARLEVLTTGPDGRYTVPDWYGRVPLVNRIYKRGYVTASEDAARNLGVDYVALSGKKGDARGEELNGMLTGCSEGEDRKLIAYYQALFSELKAVVPAGTKSRFERTFEGRIETATYGRDEAFRRHEERIKREGGTK